MLLATGSGVQSKVRPDGIQLWTLGESSEGRPCPPGKDDGAALPGWCRLQTCLLWSGLQKPSRTRGFQAARAP